MEKKQQIIDLWRTCFGDPEASIRLYFERVYKDENTMTLEREGRIVSALQILPYSMTFEGDEIPVAYVSGVCTAPDDREKGYMRQLMRTALVEMERRGFAITALIPAESWLFDYYRQFGYTEVFTYSTIHYDLPEPSSLSSISIIRPEEPEAEKLYAYFNRKLRERPACVLHTYQDYVTILGDLYIAGGKVYVALNKEEQVVGMAFVLPVEGKTGSEEKILQIKEMLFDTEEVEATFIRAFKSNYKVTEIRGTIPGKQSPKGMARVLDTDRMVDIWLSRHPRRLSREELQGMEPAALTRLLMVDPRETAYMSLMLD